MTWWSSNRLRLIQNNLREVDANMDVDALIHQLKQLEANVLMMNAGGIFAFYPSRLRYHYVTPYLKKDLLGEAIAKAHANGIRFIARFDFSKAHESVFRQRPEWFYRTREGREVNYYGIVHTCLNGGYQQRYSLDILTEVLSSYDVDGVFFNMFGYQNWDYSGNHYGICYCDNCRTRFREMYGLQLPEPEQQDDFVYRKYREFQEITAMEMLDTIHDHIKALNPQTAISTYHPHKVDIVRHESATALNRASSKWLYSAAENVMPISGSYDDKLSSNCSINAIDLTYRFTGVSRYETEIRLYENLVNGSGLDFCIIGVFEDYPDMDNMDSVAKVFRFHKKHEHLFGSFSSMADVVLVKPPASERDSYTEYLGLFKMLKESHILFDVISQNRLEQLRRSRARVVVLPGITRTTAEELDVLLEARDGGKHILATGAALSAQTTALSRLFGTSVDTIIADTTASYMVVDDKAMYPELERKQWVIVQGPFAVLHPGSQASAKLPYMAPSSFGPPERAYGHELTDRYGLVLFGNTTDSKGMGAYMGWNVGRLYHDHGFADHKYIVCGAIRHLLNGTATLRARAHPSVEINLHRLPDESYMLQLLNLSGFNGSTYEAPIDMHDIEIQLRGIGQVDHVEALVDGQTAELQRDENLIALKIPKLGVYAAYHLQGNT
ncbi:alpha-amylase family protein [Paenibacillus campinasensis]|uniref:Family 10 glycosylhydrolase n=1 Tax=Paenibacillus campinasensis TaxID=66347 RepID=A0A268F3U3_9BACL|nr:family 10 glycosylhydrolase [Paenibacillus campinasensis]PAD80048.1 hypothetical protein CHH67_01905 [Paenibacillus campinasensis]